MIRRLSVYLMIILIIGGCKYISQSEDDSTSQITASNNSQPTIEETVTNLLRTPTQETVIPYPISTSFTATNTALRPSFTETPYRIPIHDMGLETSGRLWIYDRRGNKILTIDMDTGMIAQRPYPPSNCRNIPITDKTEVICRGPEYLYLYNLATKRIQQLPIANPDRSFYIPPWIQINRFMVYGYLGDENEHQINIYSYDFSTNHEMQLAKNVQDNMFYLSNDGKHLITIIDNHIIDLLSNPQTDFTPASFENLIYNALSLSWSPINNLLYIGALDSAYNPISETNYHFIANVDSGIVQRISISTDIRQDATIGAYWSNDGQHIAIGGGLELCIVNIDTLTSECTDIIHDSGTEVIALAWSPDSRYLAFIVTDTIYIYNLETREYISLLENIDSTEIFWR